jgi:hypothetical protein
MWPYIVKVGKVMNQLDPTHVEFIQRSLAQHVSGIIGGSPLYCTPDDGHIDARNMLS